MSDNVTVCLRPFDANMDSAFLYASWRNATWFCAPQKSIKSHQFYSDETRRIRNLLKDPDILVRIACLREDPHFIVGYSVRKSAHLEFIYVKQDYRQRKIGTLLAKGITTIAEPITPLARTIAIKKNLLENLDAKEEIKVTDEVGRDCETGGGSGDVSGGDAGSDDSDSAGTPAGRPDESDRKENPESI